MSRDYLDLFICKDDNNVQNTWLVQQKRGKKK